MHPILFSAAGFASNGKEIPKAIMPHNYSLFLTKQGIAFVQFLMEDGEKARRFLHELSRGDSQKLRQINNELIDMKDCGILTVNWLEKSTYYREHHFPDQIILREEYF